MDPNHHMVEARRPKIPSKIIGPDKHVDKHRMAITALVLILIGATIQSLANYGAGSVVGGLGALVALTSAYPLRFLKGWLLIVMPLIWWGTAVLSLMVPVGYWLWKAGLL